MASLKDTKLSPTLFLLPGQDMNVTLKMLMLLGGHGELRSLSLSCDPLHVQHQLLGTGPFSLLQPDSFPGSTRPVRWPYCSTSTVFVLILAVLDPTRQLTCLWLHGPDLF